MIFTINAMEQLKVLGDLLRYVCDRVNALSDAKSRP